MEKSKDSLTKELVTTGALLTAFAPLERVKNLMQNQNAIIKLGRLSKPYNGICDCFATTIRHEGFFSLWRGNTAYLIAHLSVQAIVSIILEHGESRKDIEWTRVQTIGLGFVSFAAPQLLFYPFLYAGTRLSTDVKKTVSYTGGNRQFNGVIDVFGKTLKLDGIAGLYRGLIISVAETGIKAAVYVGLFPHYLHVSQNNILSRPMLESGVVICYEMAGYPLNTVSRRMMLTSGAVKYKGTLHAIAHILTTEGEKSFYSGAGAQILGCVVYAGTEVLTEGSSLTITW
ncbi:ADP,ATP carrier protein 3, mitochondrial-like [Gossypium hirsutum]|uniref:ADP/ATP translocase n=1 Tax=Gossypium hirsutum TaxID=3635 RepID=A0A1U8KCH4_GOSHI|nr:ADP,ATP carrier protein 3, mitochondrial-like [Gossypium hirsutum]